MVQHALAGIRACVCVLILDSVIKLGKKSIINLPAFIIALGVFFGSFFTDISTILFVVGAGALGIVIKLVERRRKAC